jgi:hypothetical protein
MTNEQWNLLLNTVHGKTPDKPVTGFIVDSPWIPGWAGVSTLQFYSSEEIWFQTNKKVVETFPDIIFIPGFWSEFGMCTEPSGVEQLQPAPRRPNYDRHFGGSQPENSKSKNGRAFTFCDSAIVELSATYSGNGARNKICRGSRAAQHCIVFIGYNRTDDGFYDGSRKQSPFVGKDYPVLNKLDSVSERDVSRY